MSEIDRLANALHKLHAHPDYEYATVKSGRKQFAGELPDDLGGWEDNIVDGNLHSCWERFDFHEEHYYRRRIR